jgi:hypothetical protein
VPKANGEIQGEDQSDSIHISPGKSLGFFLLFVPISAVAKYPFPETCFYLYTPKYLIFKSGSLTLKKGSLGI